MWRGDAAQSDALSDRSTDARCVNPPPGADRCPFSARGTRAGPCVWPLGGTTIPGTTHTCGGSSTAGFGPLRQDPAGGPNLAVEEPPQVCGVPGIVVPPRCQTHGPALVRLAENGQQSAPGDGFTQRAPVLRDHALMLEEAAPAANAIPGADAVERKEIRVERDRPAGADCRVAHAR